MLSALADLVRSRQARPRELVELTLARIESFDREINSVVALRADEALSEADALEARLAHDDTGAALPLAGLPVLVKDIEDVAGMTTTHGSLLFAQAAPAAGDGLVPGRLRAAGAIVVGKTNCPEFAYEGYTANRLFGATRNPWGLEWTPGGSSGGSAAALAAGLAPIVTATDGGGSIRIPAAFCGLAGLKPTNGLVPRMPIPAWIDLSTDGPLATSFADIRVLLDVARGPVAGDPSAVPSWSPRSGVLPGRLLAAERFVDWGPLPPHIDRLFSTAVKNVSNMLGLSVETISPAAFFPEGNPDLEWYTICGVEHAYLLGEQTIRENAELFDPGFLAWMEDALATPMATYMEARRHRFDYVRRLDLLLGDDAVLLTPVMTIEGMLADGRLPGGHNAAAPPSAYNTMVANITGHPAASLPAGLSPNGIPFGLQAIAPRFQDDLLLNLGELWESAHPWPRVAPGYHEFTLS